jgi:tetratricopeptide (TPR) repeat protein
MVFVLWDTVARQGFWLHIQSFVVEKITQESDWMTRPEASRQVHIPASQKISTASCSDLQDLVQREFKKITLAKTALIETQQSQLDNLRLSIESRQNNRFELLLDGPHPPLQPLPPQVEEQVHIASLRAAVENKPDDIRSWTALAEIYYRLDDYEQALQAINRYEPCGAWLSPSMQ